MDPKSRGRIHATLCLAVVALGLMQAVGWMLRIPALRGLGMATASSPLPIVFTEVKGVETFASGFELEYRDPQGNRKRLPIGPEEYSRLGGPYNWRNVYGAAVSYGPILPAALSQSVLKHGLCANGPLVSILGAGPLDSAAVLIATRTAGRSDTWRLDVGCP